MSLVQYGPLTVVSHEDLAILFNNHSYIRGRTPFPPVEDRTEDEESASKFFFLAGQQAGILVDATVLKEIEGLEVLDERVLNENSLRQFGVGQCCNMGEDVEGYFIIGDLVAVAIGIDVGQVKFWIKNNIVMNKKNLPSLKIVERGVGTSHHVQHAVIAKEDIFKILCEDHDLRAILSVHKKFAPVKSLCLDIPGVLGTSTSPPSLVGSQRFLKMPASMLKNLSGFEDVKSRRGSDKYEDLSRKDLFLRQMGPGQVDADGGDISGFFVLADVAAILIFNDNANASRWTKNCNQVNSDIAPSLKFINSGNPKVTLMKFT